MKKRKSFPFLFCLLGLTILTLTIIFYQINYQVLPSKAIKTSQISDEFQINLQKKGYSSLDIKQLWEWNLTNEDIPDLRAEKRIGVTKILTASANPENYEDFSLKPNNGMCVDLVVIIREKERKSPRLIINFDRRLEAIKTQPGMRKVVELFRQNLAVSQPWEVSILTAKENVNYEGKSAGIALYLALLSAYYQRPLSSKLASTGWVATKNKYGKVNGKKINLPKGSVLSIGGLRAKITAAFTKGINNFLIPKFNSAPYLLTYQRKIDTEENLAEDYQQEISPFIQARVNIDLVENCQDLEDYFFQSSEWLRKQAERERERQKTPNFYPETLVCNICEERIRDFDSYQGGENKNFSYCQNCWWKIKKIREINEITEKQKEIRGEWQELEEIDNCQECGNSLVKKTENSFSTFRIYLVKNEKKIVICQDCYKKTQTS